MSLEDAIGGRRSVREYKPEPLSLLELSRLLWAAQGITEPRSGFRAAPSAGATFPLEVYVAIGANLDGRRSGVESLQPGLYRYVPGEHSLDLLRTGDSRRKLYNAALRQDPVRHAPVVLVITGVTARTAGRYGDRAARYIAMEAGHVSQNLYLKATALGLGTVAIGAFQDRALAGALELSSGEEPLYLMPVGRR